MMKRLIYPGRSYYLTPAAHDEFIDSGWMNDASSGLVTIEERSGIDLLENTNSYRAHPIDEFRVLLYITDKDIDWEAYHDFD